jgi:hypothetical protein
MYPDFDGFARLHAHDKLYNEPDVRSYLRRGIEAHQRGNLDDAIAHLIGNVHCTETFQSTQSAVHWWDFFKPSLEANLESMDWECCFAFEQRS